MKKYLIAGIVAGLMGLLINIGSIHIDFRNDISKDAVYAQAFLQPSAESMSISPATPFRENGMTTDTSSKALAETLFLVWFGIMAVFSPGRKDMLTPVPVRVRIK